MNNRSVVNQGRTVPCDDLDDIETSSQIEQLLPTLCEKPVVTTIEPILVVRVRAIMLVTNVSMLSDNDVVIP